MAHTDDAALSAVLADVVADGGTKALFRRLLQEALQELIEDELTALIGAAPHERTDARTNQRNGGREKTPTMPATVIAERIGWTRGMTVLRVRVGQLRPLYLQAEGTGRTVYQPGELAQWDLWFPDVDIPVGYAQTARLPVIVGVGGVLAVDLGADDRVQAGPRRAGWAPLVSAGVGRGAPAGGV